MDLYMNTMVFYLGALALCGLSVILIREASPYSLSTGSSGTSMEERISRRRLAGRILLGVAALSAGMGILVQCFYGTP